MYISITKNIESAAEYIREGRIVAFPTGTAYGLACDALQGHALQRLRILKQRPQEKTFTVFLKNEALFRYFEISKDEQALLEKYRAQPLTLLLKPKEPLQHLLPLASHGERAGVRGEVGLRMIDHPLMQELADAVDVPLTATSANISGQPAAYSLEEIIKSFPARSGTDQSTYNLSLAAILDGGTLPQNPPTTIAKLENGKIKVIREGKLKLTTINAPKAQT